MYKEEKGLLVGCLCCACPNKKKKKGLTVLSLSVWHISQVLKFCKKKFVKVRTLEQFL